MIDLQIMIVAITIAIVIKRDGLAIATYYSSSNILLYYITI